MKELHKVTWYSKLLTLLAMIAFGAIGFFLGLAFDRNNTPVEPIVRIS